jgi:hypothetical protein
LDKRISDLEKRVAKYDDKWDAATSDQARSEIKELINSCTETLNRLLDIKKAQIQGIFFRSALIKYLLIFLSPHCRCPCS